MVTKSRKDGSFRFTLRPWAGAKNVSLSGSFGAWKPQTMRKQKDGAFALTLALKPGTYEYKFLVDGQWIEDPDNSTWALNPYGSVNSVLVAE